MVNSRVEVGVYVRARSFLGILGEGRGGSTVSDTLLRGKGL